MKHNILIKSIIDYNDNLKQLNHSFNLNPRIEIQLLKDFATPNWRTDSFYEFLKNNPTARIDYLHTPLNGTEEIDLIDIYDDEIFEVFNQTFRFASEIQAYTQQQITVVCHYSGSFKRLSSNECMLSNFVLRFARLIHEYPNIRVAIENVIPITCLGETREGGFLTDNVELVKFLRKTLNIEDRLFTVLDTCHAIVTDRVMTRCGLPSTPLKMFFEANQETIALIHLANVRNLGFGKFEHGVGFTSPEDKILLEEIEELYQLYGNNCDVTIEVHEHDYLNRHEYSATFNALK